MQDILDKIKAAVADFEIEATKRVGGNYAAGTRSRVKSSEIAVLLKEWRKVSKAKA